MNNIYNTKPFPCENCGITGCGMQNWSSMQLKEINDNSREGKFGKGELILSAGAYSSQVIYLKSGLVKEFTQSKEGNSEHIMQIIKPHNYLGLCSLFGKRINIFSYVSITDCTVCFIEFTVFSRLVESNGSFALYLLSSIGSNGLDSMNRFLQINRKNTFGRMADVLLYFSDEIFESNEFQLPINRQELASMAGITRESAIRTLSKFAQDNIIVVKGNNIFIQNKPLLTEISKKG